MTFTAPVLSYSLLSPILIILGGALIGVLVEAFVSKVLRPAVQLTLTLGVLLLSLMQVWRIREQESLTAAMGSVAIDGTAVLIQGSILVISIISIFLIADTEHFAALPAALPGSEEERNALKSGNQVTEVYPLTLFAIAGMMIFPIASDLITLFVALEVLSLPLYLMAGLSRRRRLASQESALKYFLLGAFSSAFFLFGAAYLYGYSASITFAGIREAIVGGGGNDVLLLIGIAFLSIGLLFKVGAVPFHAWTPDVYQGAPTPITAFMAAATKVAAFGAMLRIYYTVFANAQWSWTPVLSGIAIVCAKSVVIAGVLSSAIAAFFYIRVIVLMFFSDPVEDGTSVEIPSILTRATIVFAVIVTVALGVYPTPLLDFITDIASFIR